MEILKEKYFFIAIYKRVAIRSD